MMIPKGKRWRRSRRLFPLYQFSRRRKGMAGFGRETAAARTRVFGGGGRRRTKDLTGGTHLSASESVRAAADWTGPTWAEEREERGFGPAFGPKLKEDF
jgi:hypothetical protein